MQKTMQIIDNKFTLVQEEDSIILAQKIAHFIRPGTVIGFQGEVGAGKSFFCREIIKTYLGNKISVPSPTFNLVQIYPTADFIIYHFDLYRLKYAYEVYELGIEEALNGHVCLIEWPEIIAGILPADTIILNIKIINDTTREVIIRSNNSLSAKFYYSQPI